MEIAKTPAGQKITIPRMNGQWHPVAKMLWKAVKESGQTKFYQSSDWAMLYSLCDDISYAKQQKKRPAQLIQTIYSELGNLLVSEGSRRRVQIELYRPTEEELKSSDVAVMSEWQKKFAT